MDSSSIFIECGSSQGEDVEVDHGDCGGDNDDTLWVSAIGMCFSCLEKVKTYYQEYALKRGLDGGLDHREKEMTGSPTKARLFKANKKMNLHVRRTIQINDDAGVRINKTFQSLVKDAKGHGNIPFFEIYVRNYINKECRAIGKEGDGKALISYFCKMREQNTDFFYDIDLNDNFHVRNVFWADARSRAAYEYFGDVVTFDTTYLTNKYDMPFVAFVGVNHHGQSTLLGC
ncbi:hypothetical protein KIW84_051006 [Lathyrus oleraceus]|uniref:MULE transposase domain-containing protein n=1 Tax=Pisum sativum TaxID=3888 RepID=A0A9D5ACX8_PEA|nr:hypothetical protein KIW84_051006 [Pisum sativum]